MRRGLSSCCLVLLASCAVKPPAGQVMKVIGSTGGTIQTSDGTSVTIPAGALPNDVTVTVTPAQAQPPSSTTTQVGPTYQLGPEGQTFAVPITVTVAFDPTKLPAGTLPADLVVFTTPVATPNWTSLGGTVADATHLQAQTTHFSFITSGTAPMSDAGPVESDAGPIVMTDGGELVPDAGPVMTDGGELVPDAGPVMSDGGALVPDAGPMGGQVCVTDLNCTSPDVCISGFCAVPDAGSSGGHTDAGGMGGQVCATNLNCTSPAVCISGFCAVPDAGSGSRDGGSGGPLDAGGGAIDAGAAPSDAGATCGPVSAGGSGSSCMYAQVCGAETFQIECTTSSTCTCSTTEAGSTSTMMISSSSTVCSSEMLPPEWTECGFPGGPAVADAGSSAGPDAGSSSCATNLDCTAPSTCINGECTPPAGLDAGSPATDAGSSTGSDAGSNSCATNLDCTAPSTCINGQCSPPAATDAGVVGTVDAGTPVTCGAINYGNGSSSCNYLTVCSDGQKRELSCTGTQCECLVGGSPTGDAGVADQVCLDDAELMGIWAQCNFPAPALSFPVSPDAGSATSDAGAAPTDAGSSCGPVSAGGSLGECNYSEVCGQESYTIQCTPSATCVCAVTSAGGGSSMMSIASSSTVCSSESLPPEWTECGFPGGPPAGTDAGSPAPDAGVVGTVDAGAPVTCGAISYDNGTSTCQYVTACSDGQKRVLSCMGTICQCMVGGTETVAVTEPGAACASDSALSQAWMQCDFPAPPLVFADAGSAAGPDAGAPSDAGPGPCTVDSECAPPLVCMSGACFPPPQCESGVDGGNCPESLTCAESYSPQYCVPAEAPVTSCTTGADCPTGSIACIAGSCVTASCPLDAPDAGGQSFCVVGPCTTDSNGESCTECYFGAYGVTMCLPVPDAGVAVDAGFAGEPDAGTLVDAGPGPCAVDSDCAAPLVCMNGACSPPPRCEAGVDGGACGALTCASSYSPQYCVPAEAPVMSCTTGADCPTGTIGCFAGSCVTSSCPLDKPASGPSFCVVGPCSMDSNGLSCSECYFGSFGVTECLPTPDAG